MSAVRVLVLPLLALLFAVPAHAQSPPPVLLGTADPFVVLAGSTVTNTGSSVLNGDLGLYPGTSVTGFPPGTVNGATHINNAVAQQAKSDLTTAYDDAAGRPSTGALSPDAGGQTLMPGVYKTGGVASLGLTGNLTLDAAGDPAAVFIFQIESTLTTATDSSVTLINGGQACNVFWQVGSSATLGTRTSFIGSVLALTSISVNNGVTVDGRLLARNGAVTLDTDTLSRSGCAAGSGPGTEPGTEPGTAPGTEPGTEPGTAPGTEPGTEPGAEPETDIEPTGPDAEPGQGTKPDAAAPRARIVGPRGVLGPPNARRPYTGICTRRNFTVQIRLRDRSRIRRARVFLDGRLLKQTSVKRFSVRIRVRGLRVGRHRIRLVAVDRRGNRSVTTRAFARCALAAAAPKFTG